MKVGFAGRWNPLDKTAWSGIYFQSYQAIQKYYAIESFYYKWPWHIRETLILHKQIQKLAHKKAAVEFLKGYAKYFSKQLEKDLLKRKVDLLFVPSAPQVIAYCKTTIPIIYLNDATFFQLQGYYDLFSEIAQYNINQGIAIDKLSFEKAAHCMVASSWTKRSAMNDYHIPGEKISIVPFGANLEIIPPANLLDKKKHSICQLLFLGVEWERKGGQIALDTFYQLEKNGFPVHLTIVGCVPPTAVNNKNITVIPFLNKNLSVDAAVLSEIFKSSDFLFLPTRAECAGIVFCEAGAFGLPSVTTDTGGISTYIENGVNGFTLPLTAGANEFADKIEETFSNSEKYDQLCSNSRKRYDEQLNWESWGHSFNQIAEKILNQ